MTIKVKDLVKHALSVEEGIAIREKLSDLISSDETVTLDFEGISLYATMFFNAFVGYFIKNGNQEFIDSIKLENITRLGQETYKHSYDNAIFVMKNQSKIEHINNIIEQNINNG